MKIRKILLSILVFTLTFTSLSLNVTANTIGSSATATYTGISTWEVNKNNGHWGDACLLKVNGDVAFCLDPYVSFPSGTGTIVSPGSLGLTDKVGWLSLLAYYGYYSNPWNSTYCLTQNLIWQE